MKESFLFILTFAGGVFLAMQANLNSHLGSLLKNPLFAAVPAAFSSALFAMIFVLVTTKTTPNISLVKQVPFYLWFAGGLFSVLGLIFYFYTIPKLGISTVVSIGLCGQLIFAAIAAHYGWLGLPIEPFTIRRIIGVFIMITGTFLINIK